MFKKKQLKNDKILFSVDIPSLNHRIGRYNRLIFVSERSVEYFGTFNPSMVFEIKWAQCTYGALANYWYTKSNEMICPMDHISK